MHAYSLLWPAKNGSIGSNCQFSDESRATGPLGFILAGVGAIPAKPVVDPTVNESGLRPAPELYKGRDRFPSEARWPRNPRGPIPFAGRSEWFGQAGKRHWRDAPR